MGSSWLVLNVWHLQMLSLLLSNMLNSGGLNTHQQGQNAQYRPHCVPWVCLVFNSFASIESMLSISAEVRRKHGVWIWFEHAIPLCSSFFLLLCLWVLWLMWSKTSSRICMHVVPGVWVSNTIENKVCWRLVGGPNPIQVSLVLSIDGTRWLQRSLLA